MDPRMMSQKGYRYLVHGLIEDRPHNANRNSTMSIESCIDLEIRSCSITAGRFALRVKPEGRLSDQRARRVSSFPSWHFGCSSSGIRASMAAGKLRHFADPVTAASRGNWPKSLYLVESSTASWRKSIRRSNEAIEVIEPLALCKFRLEEQLRARSLASMSGKEGVERIAAHPDGADFDSIFFVMPPDSTNGNASVMNNTQDSITWFSNDGIRRYSRLNLNAIRLLFHYDYVASTPVYKEKSTLNVLLLISTSRPSSLATSSHSFDKLFENVKYKILTEYFKISVFSLLLRDFAVNNKQMERRQNQHEQKRVLATSETRNSERMPKSAGSG
ncbi:hypothetical protein EAG_11737 [Camponotus floridanus]|uniref:Uncharacterized protein n=1 Tax=Camponotus floridanus TaxID=104421 RepID=E2AYG6_CAMFO|nr:hypothetical protein EAG_11737 [Camponotus floridanus]